CGIHIWKLYSHLQRQNSGFLCLRYKLDVIHLRFCASHKKKIKTTYKNQTTYNLGRRKYLPHESFSPQKNKRSPPDDTAGDLLLLFTASSDEQQDETQVIFPTKVYPDHIGLSKQHSTVEDEEGLSCHIEAFMVGSDTADTTRT
ncbi:hypothetical protein ACJX0J_010168, partial [Zea mays]